MSAQPTNHADRLSSLSGEYVGRRHLAEQARLTLIGAVRDAAAAGMSEQAVADLVGVTRMTIRKWLGK